MIAYEYALAFIALSIAATWFCSRLLSRAKEPEARQPVSMPEELPVAVFVEPGKERE